MHSYPLPKFRVQQIVEPEADANGRYQIWSGRYHLDLSPKEISELLPQLIRVLELEAERHAIELAELKRQLSDNEDIIKDLDAQLEDL